MPNHLVIPGYEQVCIIGRGSYGQAILCNRISDGKRFVAKNLPIHLMTPEGRMRSLNEINVISQLKCDHIVRYVDSFEIDGNLFIIQEFADGGDFAKKIDMRNLTGQPITEEKIIQWFGQLCIAVKHMHDMRILHRDLKSDNIFMTKNNIVKLGDFGVSTVLSHSLTQAQTVCGTPAYFSPELCENKPYNNKSDMWSLGVILYELCTGQLPFPVDQGVPKLMQYIVNSGYPSVATTGVYSRNLVQLVDSLLCKDPRRRPDINAVLRLDFIRAHLPKDSCCDRIKERTLQKKRESGGLEMTPPHTCQPVAPGQQHCCAAPAPAPAPSSTVSPAKRRGPKDLTVNCDAPAPTTPTRPGPRVCPPSPASAVFSRLQPIPYGVDAPDTCAIADMIAHCNREQSHGAVAGSDAREGDMWTQEHEWMGLPENVTAPQTPPSSSSRSPMPSPYMKIRSPRQLAAISGVAPLDDQMAAAAEEMTLLAPPVGRFNRSPLAGEAPQISDHPSPRVVPAPLEELAKSVLARRDPDDDEEAIHGQRARSGSDPLRAVRCRALSDACGGQPVVEARPAAHTMKAQHRRHVSDPISPRVVEAESKTDGEKRWQEQWSAEKARRAARKVARKEGQVSCDKPVPFSERTYFTAQPAPPSRNGPLKQQPNPLHAVERAASVEQASPTRSPKTPVPPLALNLLGSEPAVAAPAVKGSKEAEKAPWYACEEFCPAGRVPVFADETKSPDLNKRYPQLDVSSGFGPMVETPNEFSPPPPASRKAGASSRSKSAAIPSTDAPTVGLSLRANGAGHKSVHPPGAHSTQAATVIRREARVVPGVPTRIIGSAAAAPPAYAAGPRPTAGAVVRSKTNSIQPTQVASQQGASVMRSKANSISPSQFSHQYAQQQALQHQQQAQQQQQQQWWSNAYPYWGMPGVPPPMYNSSNPNQLRRAVSCEGPASARGPPSDRSTAAAVVPVNTARGPLPNSRGVAPAGGAARAPFAVAPQPSKPSAPADAEPTPGLRREGTLFIPGRRQVVEKPDEAEGKGLQREGTLFVPGRRSLTAEKDDGGEVSRAEVFKVLAAHRRPSQALAAPLQASSGRGNNAKDPNRRGSNDTDGSSVGPPDTPTPTKAAGGSATPRTVMRPAPVINGAVDFSKDSSTYTCARLARKGPLRGKPDATPLPAWGFTDPNLSTPAPAWGFPAADIPQFGSDGWAAKFPSSFGIPSNPNSNNSVFPAVSDNSASAASNPNYNPFSGYVFSTDGSLRRADSAGQQQNPQSATAFPSTSGNFGYGNNASYWPSTTPQIAGW